MKRLTKAVFGFGRPLRGLNPLRGLACTEHRLAPAIVLVQHWNPEVL